MYTFQYLRYNIDELTPTMVQHQVRDIVSLKGRRKTAKYHLQKDVYL
jgi:hypothetical protein